MGVFKEEAYEFDQFMKIEPSHGGFKTTDPDHTDTLNKIRSWMNMMAGLRVGKHRTATQALDVFFVAWEQNSSTHYGNGTKFFIETRKVGNTKYVRLYTEQYYGASTTIYQNYKATQQRGANHGLNPNAGTTPTVYGHTMEYANELVDRINKSHGGKMRASVGCMGGIIHYDENGHMLDL